MTQHKYGLLGLRDLVHQADTQFCFCPVIQQGEEEKQNREPKRKTTACEEDQDAQNQRGRGHK